MNTVEIPSFLNEDFLKSALEQGLKADSVEIVSLDVSMGSAPGDNYLSQIYRVLVTYSTARSKSNVVSLIVKAVLQVSFFEKDEDIHMKETVMYAKILPAIEKGLVQGRLSPKMYISTIREPKTIVLEDMVASGYRLPNRQKGLNKAECGMCLVKLAQLHALSMMYAAKYPEEMDLFSRNAFTEHSVGMEAFQATQIYSFETTIRLAEKWPDFQDIAEKMKKILPRYGEKLLNTLYSSNASFKVLNHGDMSIGNLLLRYKDNNQVEDAAFLDYQCGLYSSPGIDVNSFLATCPAADVLVNHSEHLLRSSYCETLRRTLEIYNYENVPSEETIMAEIRSKSFYGVCVCVGMLSLTMMTRTEDASYDSYSSGKLSSSIENACNTQRFQDSVKFLLKIAEKNKGLE